MIRELENIASCLLKLRRINKNSNYINFQSHDTVHGIRGTPIHLWSKASGILNTHRAINAYGSLIKRSVKKFSDHIYKRKMIRELENIASCLLKLRRINKNKNYNNF